MAKNSTIEWTDHTFNPWWGCTKVSPGCTNCYAESWAKRVGAKVWGYRESRLFFGERHWEGPLNWNAEAEQHRRRRRVFCASMADIFELRSDLDPWRQRLWDLIERTPWLDWLLLTKRPQNIKRKVPWRVAWPDNVWLGTTVEDQQRADERLPLLLQHPAKVRFLSCEPLLGPIDLTSWIQAGDKSHYPVDWVIAGGESGPNARPMLPGWARRVRDQCLSAGIPFHFKQWGHWAPVATPKRQDSTTRNFWDEVMGAAIFMKPLGKKIAGRSLDGATWDQLPNAA